MSKLLSITLPDLIHAALTKQGAELEQSAAEFVRTFFIMASKDAGSLLKLELPPLPQGDLPLFDAVQEDKQQG